MRAPNSHGLAAALEHKRHSRCGLPRLTTRLKKVEIGTWCSAQHLTYDELADMCSVVIRKACFGVSGNSLELMLDGFFNQSIQAHPAGCSGERGTFMRCFPQTQLELARETLERIDSTLTTNLKENIEGALALAHQLINTLAIEVSAAIEAEKLAAEKVGVWIVGEDGLVAADLNDVLAHGFTPLLSSHFLMLATAPLSVSGCG